MQTKHDIVVAQRVTEDKAAEKDIVLRNIYNAKYALAEAKSLDTIIKIHDIASAAVAWAKARGSNEAAQMAMEIKLRSERKAGQSLAEMKEQDLLSKGGNPNLTVDNVSTVEKPTLKSLGVEHKESQRWQKIAEIPEEKFEEKIETAKKITQNMFLHNAHVGHATGENEWYTPECYIEAVKELMGTIDVDPASSERPNKIVQASTYYTIETDGLKQKWTGNVWMNPPYSQPLIKEFCDLLVKKFLDGEVKQACVLVNNATETGFYQTMLQHCQAVCFIAGRVKFLDKEGNSTGAPLQGQTILYFGENPEAFYSIFSKFGVVLHAK